MKNRQKFEEGGSGAMAVNDYLIDTNILNYHTAGDRESVDFLRKEIRMKSFHISILTKIEFLGWDKHTPEGLEKCRKLIDTALVHPVDEKVARQTIEIRRKGKVKLADALIAATALSYGLTLVTKNTSDFNHIEGLFLENPFG